MKKKVYSIIAILIIALSFFLTKDEKGIPRPEEGFLYSYFLDVGQGDCTFFVFQDGETMLIDAGNNIDGEIITEKLKYLGTEKINYVICTHPHSDHIGGMAEVIGNFDVGNIYMPDAYNNTSTFEKLLDKIEEKGLGINVGISGMVIKEDEESKIEFLSPLEKDYEELNEYSIVTKVTYKDNSFLVMGDAHKSNEKEILKAYDNVESDVIRLGHHGSYTSSGNGFIKKVDPDIAIISVGEGNDYGHPSHEVLNTMEKLYIKTLRTDKSGDIVLRSDGTAVEILAYSMEDLYETAY